MGDCAEVCPRCGSKCDDWIDQHGKGQTSPVLLHTHTHNWKTALVSTSDPSSCKIVGEWCEVHYRGRKTCEAAKGADVGRVMPVDEQEKASAEDIKAGRTVAFGSKKELLSHLDGLSPSASSSPPNTCYYCDHLRDAHDFEGVCEMRYCECRIFRSTLLDSSRRAASALERISGGQ